MGYNDYRGVHLGQAVYLFDVHLEVVCFVG